MIKNTFAEIIPEQTVYINGLSKSCYDRVSVGFILGSANVCGNTNSDTLTFAIRHLFKMQH